MWIKIIIDNYLFFVVGIVIITLLAVLVNELIFMKRLIKLTKELKDKNKECEKLIKGLKIIKEVKITNET